MPYCGSCRRISVKPLQVTVGSRVHRFDSFACALRSLAPRCPGCDDFVLFPVGALATCERCDLELVHPQLEIDPVRNHFATVGEAAWESLGLTFGPSLSVSPQAG